MASKRNKETKVNTKSKYKGKLDGSKNIAEEPPPLGPPEPIPWVNPLPLITGKEVFTPLGQGEHQFISILNSHGSPSLLTRLQKIENVFDDPYRPPYVVEHYDGSSWDCYFRSELAHQYDLCEICEEIWRRWNWKYCPPPPKEIDPYESLLCVGDIDPNFEPTRGDIVIFHPFGPQAMLGLRAEWGFVLSYESQKGLEFHPHDLVVRLGSFSVSKNVVDYIPYDSVDVRAKTKDNQWRFLGAQVALVREPPVKPSPSPIQPDWPLDKKDGKKNKKGKREKKKESKKDGSQDKEGEGKSGKKKKSEKDKKKDKKSGKKDFNTKEDGETNGVQIGALPEFTLDDIPETFNIIQKVLDPFVPHPGETIFKAFHPSLTCNYKYGKPGMQCGMGEFLPQLGDIVINEPQAWMHDDWGDKKKRQKGSMVKWYKPSPWKRELKQGMVLLRPHIDRYTQFLDGIPQSEYTPLRWSQWGVVELYLFEGRVTQLVEPIQMDSDLVGGEKDVNKDKKGNRSDKNTKKGEKKVVSADEKDKENVKHEGKRKEKSNKDDPKTSKKSKKAVGEENKTTLGENNNGNKDGPNDDLLWKYWGRSIHCFDEPFQFWALHNFCRKRHLREVEKLEHLDFFVEDTGVESDLEHAPKIEEVPQEPKGKKGKGDTLQDKRKEGDAKKKKKKT